MQKEYMIGKITESCKRLKSMTFVSVNADSSDNNHHFGNGKPIFLSDLYKLPTVYYDNLNIWMNTMIFEHHLT